MKTKFLFILLYYLSCDFDFIYHIWLIPPVALAVDFDFVELNRN